MYPAQIMRYGYTHKVHVTIDDVVVVFEPDEEGNYRAAVDPASAPNISKALLEDISATLRFLLTEE